MQSQPTLSYVVTSRHIEEALGISARVVRSMSKAGIITPVRLNARVVLYDIRELCVKFPSLEGMAKGGR